MNEFTEGGFNSEDEAWEHFDYTLSTYRDHFRVHREVRGELLQPRYDTGSAGVRIDRIVVPSQAAIDAGWVQGPFGVEIKRSGKKLGRMVCQAMDYTRSVFSLPNGFLVGLQWVFVYPVIQPRGDIESVMAQNRIGWACAKGDGLCFGSGGTNGLVLNGGYVSAKALPMGKQRGSR